MHPVLIVEGKPYNASIAMVGYYDEHKKYHAVTVDEKTEIKWQGRYDEVYQTLDKAIVDNQERMQILANEIADHENSFIPCPQKDERNKLKLETVGLIDAQEIVHSFMVDDVDLTGDENVGH